MNNIINLSVEPVYSAVAPMTIEALVRKKLIDYSFERKSLVVSVVGAGGKTSLIYHLANQLRSDFKILVTTTTMMFKPTHEVDQIIFQNDIEDAHFVAQLKKVQKMSSAMPQITGLFFNEVGEGTDIDGRDVIKVKGIHESVVNQIADAYVYDLILVEADGSRRRPLKAYAPHEPVLPYCTDLLIAVMGLKGLNAPISDKTVHRLDQFLWMTGKQVGDTLQIEDLLHLFTGKESFLKSVPIACDVVALFNQGDAVTLSCDFSDLSKNLFRMSSKIKGFFVVSIEKTLTYVAYLRDGESK